MTQSISTNSRTSRIGEPVWEIAELFPEQGHWSEGEYLALGTNRLVEFDNGVIEVLPMPKKLHQLIMMFLRDVLKSYFAAKGLRGQTIVAGYKIRIPGGKYREPDVVYLTPEQNKSSNEDFTERAELVIEVVSPDDPNRDYVQKRRDYAAAAISEYWIVDHGAGHVLVLKLVGNEYVEHGKFIAGQVVTSHRFPGLKVAVDQIWNPHD